jgi:outer membrane receptor for ferrienterochelin and colicins
VVLGPGSALYGPDVTTGVIHFISKTPFKHPGTTVELIYGERNTFRAGIRHAGKNEKETFGYKINLRYSSGKDFTLDPNNTEDSQILAEFKTSINRATISAEGNVDTTSPGTKLFDITQTQKQDYWAGLANASLYFRPENGMEIVTAGGWNAGTAIFYNDLGEGQAFGNEYWGQARFNYKGLFAQTYFIKNDGGNDKRPNYLNRTGFITPLERTHYEAQLQYNFDWPGLLDSEWTTGVDYRSATANTENHVYGRNEDDDDYRILGGYLQGKFRLDPKLDLFMAGRYDGYNFTDEKTFSPRAAFVYKPSDQHNIRLTYNRAANPIAASDIYFDLPVSIIRNDGFNLDAWVLGAREIYSFAENPNISWALSGIPNTPLAAGFPLAVAFAAVNEGVINGIVEQLQQSALLAPLIPLAQNILSNPQIIPNNFIPVETVDIDGNPLTPEGGQGNLLSFLTSYELGYKGVVSNRLSFGVDIYYFRRKGGATFRQITPVVNIQNLPIPENLGQTVQNNTQGLIEQGLIDLGNSPAVAAATAASLAPQVNAAYTQGGELFLQSLEQAGLPFHGIVQIEENTADFPRLTSGYLSIDDTVVNEDWGAEFNFKFFATEALGVQGNYTWFALDNDNPGDASFPTHKIRLGFNYDPDSIFDASLNYQWDDGFTSNSPVFPGSVPAKNLVDLTLGLNLGEPLRLEVAAINLFNNRFRALPGFPRLGRTVTGRLVMNLN